MWDSGVANAEAQFFKNKFGIPSGPADSEDFCCEKSCEKQRSQDRALRNTSKKFYWRGGVVAKFHILGSVRKVRL